MEYFHYFSFIFFFSEGWEFEMQAAQTDNNKTILTGKGLQIAFVTNIQAMLECFISLYELDNSTLLDVFLHPSSQFEDYNPNDDFVKNDRVRMNWNKFADFKLILKITYFLDFDSE